MRERGRREPADVIIRPWVDGDLGLLRRLLGESETMRYLGGPESPEAIEARHQRYLTADPETNGLFAVTAGDADAGPVGWVGFWESERRGETVWECGWHVAPEAQGRGVATAATALLLDEARRRGRHREVHAFPSVDNVASNALCRTLGFHRLGELEVEYPQGHLMREQRLAVRAVAAARPAGDDDGRRLERGGARGGAGARARVRPPVLRRAGGALPAGRRDGRLPALVGAARRCVRRGRPARGRLHRADRPGLWTTSSSGPPAGRPSSATGTATRWSRRWPSSRRYLGARQGRNAP